MESLSENIEIDLDSVTRALTQQIADLSLKCAMQEGAIKKLRQKLSEAQQTIDEMANRVVKEDQKEISHGSDK